MFDELDVKSCADLLFWVGESVFFVWGNVMDPCSFVKELDVAFLLSDVEEIGLVVSHVFLPAILIKLIGL